MKTKKKISSRFLVFAILILLFVSQGILTAYAQNRSDTARFNAMAMGSLAQREYEVKKQNTATNKEIRTAAVTTIDDEKGHEKDLETKDAEEK